MSSTFGGCANEEPTDGPSGRLSYGRRSAMAGVRAEEASADCSDAAHLRAARGAPAAADPVCHSHKEGRGECGRRRHRQWLRAGRLAEWGLWRAPPSAGWSSSGPGEQWRGSHRRVRPWWWTGQLPAAGVGGRLDPVQLPGGVPQVHGVRRGERPPPPLVVGARHGVGPLLQQRVLGRGAQLRAEHLFSRGFLPAPGRPRLPNAKRAFEGVETVGPDEGSVATHVADRGRLGAMPALGERRRGP